VRWGRAHLRERHNVIAGVLVSTLQRLHAEVFVERLGHCGFGSQGGCAVLPVANDIDNAAYIQVQKHEQFGNTSEAEERKEYLLYRIVIFTWTF
jgi:hypothetical protein